MNLTNNQKDILLNIILGEQNNICNQNLNIYPLLKGYKEELRSIYKIICDSMD